MASKQCATRSILLNRRYSHYTPERIVIAIADGLYYLVSEAIIHLLSMINHRIKFRHLQCFIEVVRQGGVVKAADYLCITQPAVSKKLKELEDMLGVTLLARSRKGVSLTEQGDLFLRYALSSSEALQEGIDQLSYAIEALHPPLIIGVLPTVAARIMPLAIERFKQQQPQVTVAIESGPTSTLLSRLRVSELDLVVGRLAEPSQMQGLVFEQLYLERLAIVVRPNHPVLHSNNRSLQAISEWPIIMPTADSIIRKTAEQWLISHGISTHTNRLETVAHDFGSAYVKDTDAIWIISHGTVARDIADGTLTELNFDARDTLGPVGFTSRIHHQASEPLALLMSEVRAVAATANIT